MKILPEDIAAKKTLYTGAEVLVHPECPASVTTLADKVLSTEGICRYVQASGAKEFIIGTEIGILHRLKKENPEKTFYPVSEKASCPNMKLTTLEKILWSLRKWSTKSLCSPVSCARQEKVSKMIDYKL